MKETLQKIKKLTPNGNIQLTERGIVELLNRKGDNLPDTILVDFDVETFNRKSKSYGMEIKLDNSDPVIDHEARTSTWSYPSEIKDIDVNQYLFSLCKTQEEKTRVEQELRLFKERGMMDLLYWSIWFVGTAEQNDVFFGLGRGSSCSVYCFYLIKLHMVDSIKYELDYKEFFK